MLTSRFFLSSLLLGSLATLGTAVPARLASQQVPSPATQVHRAPYSRYQQIHVDQDCRLLPDPSKPVVGNKKPHLQRDPEICHLDTVLSSNHIEEHITEKAIERNAVSITEQTYVLQNVTDDPAIFVVEQYVPEGWAVDSDPQPINMVGPTAVFRVNAQPGEIVQLHVGLRHSKPLHPKALKASPFSPAGPVTN